MKFRVAALACLCLVGRLAFAQVPPIGVARYEVVAIIDHEAALGMMSAGVNERGEVAGWYTTAPGCTVPRVSFVWRNGEFQYISVPGAFSTTAEAIDDRGYVAGGFFVSGEDACAGGWRQAFVMSPDGEFRTLPWTSLHSIVTGITNNGWLAGPTALCDWTGGAEDCLFGFLYNGRDDPVFLAPPGCRASIETADVNTRGDVVGGCRETRLGLWRGWQYRKGAYEFVDFPGATGTMLMGMNSAGDVIGFAWMPEPGGTVNFIRRGGSFAYVELTGIDGLASFRIHEINNAGMMVGTLQGADGHGRGFLARPIHQ
jgi:uncharacterized membrane protein